MRRSRLRTPSAFVVAAAWLVLAAPSAAGSHAAAPAAPAAVAPAPTVSAVAAPLPPLVFERPDGVGGAAALTALGRDARIDFHPGGLTIASVEPAAAPPTGPRLDGLPIAFDADGGLRAAPPPAPMWRRVEVDLVGAAAARPRGEGRRAGIVSLFKGTQPHWQTGLPTFAAVRYPDAWPGVDIVLAPQGDGLALRVEAAPGADPAVAALRVRCDGACPTTARGLAALAGDGRAAIARWQGGDRPWAVEGGAAIDPTVDGDAAVDRSVDGTAAVGRWFDRADAAADAPAVGAIVQAGFFGFPGDDRGLGLDVGPDGAAYLTGHTFAESETDIDGYVVKIRPDGSAIDYVAILGGDGYDTAFDVAVDRAGNAVFVGGTGSLDDSRPSKGGPDLTHNGVQDAWVCAVDPTGRDLAFCGVIGGSSFEMAEGVAIDAAGHVYVTGMTGSSALSFPAKIGPDLTGNGMTDSFVTKLALDPTKPAVLDNIVYSGYIGGNRHDCYIYERNGDNYVSSGHIAVDAFGAAYISGQTQSTETTFPNGGGFGAIPGADQTFAGAWDAWITKVRADGKGFDYATFFGGAKEDLAFGMDVDAVGAAYFAAWTDSTEDTLEPVGGPDLTFNGNSDAMAGKLTPDGRAFAYLGYIGGVNGDAGMGAKVDAYGRLAVFGYTESDATTFPVAVGPDLTLNSTEINKGDGFVTLLAADPTAPDVGANVVLSGYIGGSEWDETFWVDFGPDGALHVVGDTTSGPDTFPDGGGLAGRPGARATAAGASDAFHVKIVMPPPPDGAPTPPATATTGPPLPTASAPAATPTARPSEDGPAAGRAFLPWAMRP